MNPPARIASLLASSTEILYGLGLGDRVVAVSHECDFPEEVQSKPRVTRTLVNANAPSRTIDEEVKAACTAGEPLYRIDVERLVSLRPDLIVTQAQCDVCAVRYSDVVSAVQANVELQDTRIVSLNPHSLRDVFNDVLRVGDSAGVPDRATANVAALQSRIEAVSRKTRALPRESRPRTACIEWVDPPMLAGNWIPELIDLAGGRCELARAGEHSTFVDWHDVVEFDPEVVVVMPCGFNLSRSLEDAKILTSFPGWKHLSAVRNGRVFAVDGNAYFNRSGPRLVDSVEVLAGILHPDRFPAPTSQGTMLFQGIRIGGMGNGQC